MWNKDDTVLIYSMMQQLLSTHVINLKCNIEYHATMHRDVPPLHFMVVLSQHGHFWEALLNEMFSIRRQKPLFWLWRFQQQTHWINEEPWKRPQSDDQTTWMGVLRTSWNERLLNWPSQTTQNTRLWSCIFKREMGRQWAMTLGQVSFTNKLRFKIIQLHPTAV